jgi:hypothetical protein
MRLLVSGILAATILAVPGSALASTDRSVDMRAIVEQGVQATLDAMTAEIDQGASADSDGMMIRFLATAFSHQWQITYALMNGLDGVKAAADYLKGQQDAIVSKYSALWVKALNSQNTGENTSNTTGYLGADFVPVRNIAVDVSHIAAALDGLENVSAAVGAENAVYRKSQVLGFVILMMAFVVRLGFVAYNLFIGKSSSDPMEPVFVIFKFIAVIILLFGLRYIIYAGLDLSSAAKDAILGGSAGQEDMIANICDLMRLRRDLAGVQAGGTVTSLSAIAAEWTRTLLGLIAYYLALAVIFVLLLLGDIMMGLTAILGPLVIAVSFLPSFESYMGHWLKSFITFLFYAPLAAVYLLVLVIIMGVGLDQSFLTFIVISIGYIMGASKVPEIAQNLSGAALAGVATGIAMMPAAMTLMAAKGLIGLPMAAGRALSAPKA